ncbi:MAG: lysophospholipid acyltransferase family protein [Pseudomonadota bacterium]
MSDWLHQRYTPPRISPMGWLRVLGRGLGLGVVTYSGLVILLALRVIERPVFGLHRPWTPFITQGVCRAALFILRLGYEVHGRPMTAPGAFVANHTSWLDIFTLNAGARLYFVAKAEVSGWAGIGWLARATGTVFITRKGGEAKRQQALFEARLGAGHPLLFFPEGTSTDALRVLPFKSTLFAAFFTAQVPVPLQIQPVTVIYHAPQGTDPRHYGWWGDMSFAAHLVMVLADARPGRVEVIYHPPVPVPAFADRKDLSAYCERIIRTSHKLAALSQDR